jgi:hypothetical protein
MSRDLCRYCKEKGLVLSTINADYSCEYCGQWQYALLNSAWIIIGHADEDDYVRATDSLEWQRAL